MNLEFTVIFMRSSGHLAKNWQFIRNWLDRAVFHIKRCDLRNLSVYTVQGTGYAVHHSAVESRLYMETAT